MTFYTCTDVLSFTKTEKNSVIYELVPRGRLHKVCFAWVSSYMSMCDKGIKSGPSYKQGKYFAVYALEKKLDFRRLILQYCMKCIY